jgi:hypothetical protein
MMKRNLLWLALTILASGIAIASLEPLKAALKETPVEKTISFSLYKGSNYASKIYNCSSAQIYITLEKVRSTTRTVVWDTTFDTKLLSKYPSAKKALSQKVTIQNVIENKEHLEINYVLTYNSNGSIIKIPSGSFVLDGLDTLAISL